MNKMLGIKAAVATAALGLGLFAAVPAGAQTDTTIGGEVAVLTVTKTVDGTAPADTSFTLHITCTGRDTGPTIVGKLGGQATDYDEDIVFGATGGSHDYVFSGPSDCTVTETDDGGADASSGPVDVAILAPTSYDAEIINTFDPVPTTAPPAQEAAVEAAPAFTG